MRAKVSLVSENKLTVLKCVSLSLSHTHTHTCSIYVTSFSSTSYYRNLRSISETGLVMFISMFDMLGRIKLSVSDIIFSQKRFQWRRKVCVRHDGALCVSKNNQKSPMETLFVPLFQWMIQNICTTLSWSWAVV